MQIFSSVKLCCMYLMSPLGPDENKRKWNVNFCAWMLGEAFGHPKSCQSRSIQKFWLDLHMEWSCLQVSKQKLDTICAILPQTFFVKSFVIPSLPHFLKNWNRRDRMIELVGFLYTVLLLCTILFHKHKMSFKQHAYNGANWKKNRNIFFFFVNDWAITLFPNRTTRQSELVLFVWYKIWVRNVIQELVSGWAMWDYILHWRKQQILMDIER